MSNPIIDALKRPGMSMRVVERAKFDHEYWNGRALVWLPPEKGFRYVVGVDVAEGVGGDSSVVEVLRCGTREHCDIQVAEWASDMVSPIELAPVINMLGKWYSEDDGTEAMAIIECNNMGIETQNQLRFGLEYSNLFQWKIYDKRTNMITNRIGWWTNPTTRKRLVARGTHGINRGDITINSSFLLKEMADFQQDYFAAKAQARASTHDDRVMAMLMAYWGAHDDELMAGEDVAEERRLLQNAGARLAVQEEVTGAPADWFSTPMSVDKMYQAWDESFGDY
jgi:hypothetical protein